MLLSAGTAQYVQSVITLVLKLPFSAVCLVSESHDTFLCGYNSTRFAVCQIQITVSLPDNLPVTSGNTAQRSHVDAQPLGDPDAAGVVQSTSMIYGSFLIFQRLLPTSQIN